MNQLRTALAVAAVFLAAPSGASNGLTGEDWVNHFQHDIKPWFLDAGALGAPVGNFPTFRDLTGAESRSPRFVRMMGRQIYTYAMGYNLTGDPALLRAAYAGMEWQLAHAKHGAGGFYPLLDEQGIAIPGQLLTAQDQAYSQVGMSAIYTVSRDPRAKAEMDEMREMILRGRYWDEVEGTVKDAFNENYAEEASFEAPGNDLVSVLDQLNSYLMLYFNQNPNPTEKMAQLQELKLLADRVVNGFWQDGIFWNTDENRTDYDASHVDTGHTIKAYWLLGEIDRYWAEAYGSHPYRDLVERYGNAVLHAAYNPDTHAWNQRFEQDYRVTSGIDPAWWIFCEADQFAARQSLSDKSMAEILKSTSDFWLNGNFIDRGRPVRGIREGIRADGSLWGDVDSWDSKQNHWKNGYHETEQALVLYLMTQARNNKQADLYFAVPRDQLATFKPQPYYFRADVLKIQELTELPDLGLVQVKVTFKKIR